MLLTACGGPSSNGPAAKTTGDASGESSDPGASGPAGPQLPSCDDGSCFHCGDTVCLPGYYCESDGDSNGCAWNGKCAKQATCACLASELSNDPRCSCEDRDGHAFVTCKR